MKVSIITPVYRPSEAMWHATVTSVLEQRSSGAMPEFEWVIVFDGVAGGEILSKSYQLLSSYENIKMVTLWQNYGPSVARNVGFQVSDGDIITYLDAGDIIRENRIADLARKHGANEHIVLMFSPYFIIQDGQPNRILDLGPLERKREGAIRELLQETNISTPLGVSHKRWVFNMAGGFQPGIVCGEDGILWRRMVDILSNGEIMCNDEVAGTYYVVSDSQSRTQRRYDQGGFAFDAEHPDGRHGQYLDWDWYEKYHSRDLYDPQESA